MTKSRKDIQIKSKTKIFKTSSCGLQSVKVSPGADTLWEGRTDRRADK